MKRITRQQVAYVTGGLSILLLAISLWGVYVDPYREYKEKYHLKSTSSLYTILDDSFHSNGPSGKFLSDVVNNIGRTVKYDWPDDVDYMPIQENWILHFLKSVDPLVSRYLLSDPKTKLFGKVELPDYDHAFSRGFGICSQLSLGTADLLYKRYGINARVAGLNGHVTVQIVGVAGKDIIIDPSFSALTVGHVLRPDLIDKEFLKSNDLVRDAYLSKDDNYIAERAGWSAYSKSNTKKQWLLFHFVIVSYWMKWLVPLAGFAFSLFNSKVSRSGLIGFLGVWLTRIIGQPSGIATRV